jgi:hypothetical protein
MSGRTTGVLVKVENSLQGEWRSERWEGANKAQRAGAVVPRNPQKCSVYAQVAEWLMAADCKSAAPRSYEGSNPSLCTSKFSSTS